MAFYYNGKPVNPIISLLIGAVVAIVMISIGIFLLPVIGGLLLCGLAFVAIVALYAMYRRWRYGDPMEQMRKAFEEANARAERAQRAAQGMPPFGEDETDPAMREGNVQRTGVKRITTVDDAVVVEEIHYDRKSGGQSKE